MIRKEYATARAAAKVAAFAAVLCVAGCAWATALDDIPGDTEIYTAAQTDAAIAAATGAIHVAEADLTPATNYANQVARDSTNYTDAVAGEFSDGTRTVSYSETSGFANTAGSLIGDGTIYNASDLIRESTNAAKAVVGPVAVASTNYTDAALGAFAATGSVARAAAYGTTERWTDATGCVWEVVTSFSPWTMTYHMGWDDEQISDFVGPYWWQEGGPCPEMHDGAGWYLEPGATPTCLGRSETALALEYREGDWIAQWERELVTTTNLVGRVALTNDIPDVSGYATQLQSTNAAVSVADAKISTNNAAFVSAVLAVPLTGADAGDLAELSEYGSYGTVGAAILALIAGLAALKRRMGTAETTISGKLDGAAAYPEWDGTVPYNAYECVWYDGSVWVATADISSGLPPNEDPLWVRHSGNLYSMIQEKQDALTSAQLAAANSGATAAKVATWDGYAAQIAQKANATDVATALAQKASLTDLPYRLVEPGKWEFSDGQSHEISGPNELFDPEEAPLGWVYQSSYNGVTYFSQVYETEVLALATLEITFSRGGDSFTATRASLPGHLLARAGNRVVVSGDTTLTLPAAVPGYLRDFLVRLEISGSTVPTITFQGQGSEAPNGADEITYETDGDEFPVPDEAGTWSYSFTENCVAHKFAVSLKKVNEVAAPQAQGGS